MKELKVKQYDINEVDEITLLSIRETKRVPRNILSSIDSWWLRTCGGTKYLSACVDRDGDIDEYGEDIYYANLVRPAFRIKNLNSETGNKIMIGKTWCTVVGTDLVLTDYPICEHIYDEETNKWETSELEEFINSDEFKAMI